MPTESAGVKDHCTEKALRDEEEKEGRYEIERRGDQRIGEPKGRLGKRRGSEHPSRRIGGRQGVIKARESS